MRYRKPLILLLVVAGLVTFLRACPSDFAVKPGSYKKIPNGISISEYEDLLEQSAVIKVADADTITLLGSDEQRYRIRLQGIDAPERKQAFGQVCKEKVQKLLKQQRVDIEAYKLDRYKRLIAKVIFQGEDVALEMIRQGCGWHYKQYADEQSWLDQRAYAKAERYARDNALGLWQGAEPVAPWDFRRR